jgi:Tfp pilus assembly protein PilO
MKLGNQMWAIISILLVGAIVAGGWFLAASPLLTAKAEADAQFVATEQVNQQHAATLVSLRAASKDLPELLKRARELESAIPSGLESSPLITAINDLAAATGVSITAIRIDDGVSYQEPSAEQAPDGAPNPLTDARITGENFVLIPLSFEVVGGLPNVLAFIHGIQTGERLVLVTELDTAADGEGSTTYTATISGTTYVLMRPPVLQIAAASDEDNTPSPSGSASPTPTPTPTPDPSDSATPTPTPTSTTGP